MIPNNFTLQDLFGSLLGFLIFPIVLLIPGYVLSWFLNLFEFRKRFPIPKLGIALLISIGISPILVYLLYLYLSILAVWLILISFFVAFIWIVGFEFRRGCISGPTKPEKKHGRYEWWALGIGGTWVLAAILSLADLQIGDRLYFSIVANDYTTRAAVVDAITRTGVPPVNPSYFPGHPVPLTFLYYFWYILVSLVDQFGGSWVGARTALIASAAWCGLALMTVVALYIRFQRLTGGRKAWRSGLLGMALLAVSGLDIIPFFAFATALLRQNKLFIFLGDIESWNEEITAWTGSALWAPNHLAGAIACLVGLMLFQYARCVPDLHRRIAIAVLIGLAFASSLGLSVWVTLVFAVFWGVWMLEILLVEKQPGLVGLMALAGFISILTASPFVLGTFRIGASEGGASAIFPIALTVRSFIPAGNIIENAPGYVIQLVNLALLPVSYFLELGFFFMVGLIWFQYRQALGWKNNPQKVAEALLLLTVVLVASFIKSQVIDKNDLGWRSWMLGQFVLIVWAVDLIPFIWERSASKINLLPQVHRELARMRPILVGLLVIGTLTTVVSLLMLRFYPIIADHSSRIKTVVGIDSNLGKRFFAGRMTYEFIRDNTPENAIIQYNPTIYLDLPSGLYQTRQMVISDHSIYGVSHERYIAFVKAVAVIFKQPQSLAWEPIDQVCRQYSIDFIVVGDNDLLWDRLAKLTPPRPPVYRNDFYQVLRCGSVAITGFSAQTKQPGI